MAQVKQSAKTNTVSSARPKTKLDTSIWLAVLVFVLVLQAAVTGVLLYGQRQSHDRIHALSGAIEVQGGAISTLQLYASFTRPTISVSDNAVYLPELHLKLPLNDTTVGLLYSVRQAVPMQSNGSETTVVDITTQEMADRDPGTPRRLSCTPVRLAFEAKANPYNPHETDVASTSLADGRTVQAYAFNEPSCRQLFSYAQVNSTALGEVFKQAQSY